MSNTDEKVIELSKKKIFLSIIGCIAFVGVGVWMLSLDQATIEAQRKLNSPLIVYGIGLVAIVFFGYVGILHFKKMFNSKPGLIFNCTGIVDNSSGVSAGLIPWSEIVGAYIYEIKRSKMLIIKVEKPEKYLERGGVMKKVLNNSNYKMCGSPIAISSTTLKINFPDLLILFEQYYQKYNNA